MLNKTFEHNGNTFTVRTNTGRDDLIKTALLYDAGKFICQAKGIDVENLPYSLDRLMTKFIEWMLVTSISGDILPKADLYSPSVVGLFEAWDELMQSDNDLWVKWDTCYKEVNQAIPLVSE